MAGSESEVGRSAPRSRRPHSAPQRQAAALSLARAFEPLVDMCLGLGITSPEMERVLRSVFVTRAAAVLSRGSRRARPANDTRIGLMIGVHRNVVRAIRTTKPRVQLEKVQRRHRGTALLQAWASDWQFLTAAGQPRDLPIHAHEDEPSFEALVRRYMPGISAGTAIAELRRSGAIRLLPDELIRLRSRTARTPGITTAGIEAASEQMGALASTLLHNLKMPDDAWFCESLGDVEIDPERLAIVKQLLAKRARSFMDATAAELTGETQAPHHKRTTRKVGLVVCAYEKPS